MAVLIYNDGASSILKVLPNVGIEPGYYAMLGAQKTDVQLIQIAERAATTQSKKRRNIRIAHRARFQKKALLTDKPMEQESFSAVG